MLLKFTHFIFTTIDTPFITTDIEFTTKHTYFIKINTGSIEEPKCHPFFSVFRIASLKSCKGKP